MRFLTVSAAFAATLGTSLACDNCYGPRDDAVHVRNVRRMQPEALNATTSPKAPLAWGQLNFLHTTDTHGWLEGHLKERNYGADWGDFVSFSKDMKKRADQLKVDLLLVDTGDLHDGAGLSDATNPNGLLSNPVFENLDYDLLTIGNHELYISAVAYETFQNFSKAYGERYLTSNVQIINPATKQYEYIGHQYRYFTTKHGLRIMSFGVLFDFTGNSNVSKVIKAADLVKETWFLNAVNYTKPIDLFLVIGHNPSRPTVSSSTFGTLYKTIRNIRPNIPIQAFGGHSHVRDFVVYDQAATGLESGRYCETLGWLSVTGINSSSYHGATLPKGIPHPSQKAIKVVTATGSATTTMPTETTSIATGTKSSVSATASSSAPTNLLYARRYLDWNRLTFAYHAVGSQDHTFDTPKGEAVSANITAIRKELNLTTLYGCAPRTWCQTCEPFGAAGNLNTLLEVALATVVVNQSRADIPRIIIINTGSTRFDLAQGPFTYDDSFIVSPFTDAFQFIPEVPYNIARQILGILNAAPADKKRRDLLTRDFGFSPVTGDVCVDAVPEAHIALKRRAESMTRNIYRRQSTSLTPGYVTSDDFGTDGDDTIHSKIPYYPQPENLEANASFPTNGSLPTAVDLIFLDYIAPDVTSALQQLTTAYTIKSVGYYLPKSFTTNSYLPLYAQKYWQAGIPNCPVSGVIG